MQSDHNFLSMHDGVELNRLLFRALPSLDARILLDPNLCADRRDKLKWLIGAYYAFPDEHWRHLRTTNIIESNFDPVRSRTNVCKRLRSGSSATYLVYALLMRRADRWRRFNDYQRLAEVHKQTIARPVAIKKAA